MKFLSAQRQAKSQSAPENKMQPGSRSDQDGSSPRRGATESNEEIESLAKELDVDLTKVVGTGKQGKVMAKDVRQAHADAITAKIPLSGQSPKI